MFSGPRREKIWIERNRWHLLGYYLLDKKQKTQTGPKQSEEATVSLCVPLRTLSSEATQRWLFFLGFSSNLISSVSLCVPLRTLSSEATQRWLFFLGFSSNLISSGRRSDESLSSGTKHSEFNLGIHLGVVVNV
ncbi:hypothetical protein CFP56_023640 [Quercus suber]|uniref:Uncharacterized protein n=1 Tax=Quercus suber TaxID=58331 RepID=A0AAW0LXC8_QUESU